MKKQALSLSFCGSSFAFSLRRNVSPRIASRPGVQRFSFFCVMEMREMRTKFFRLVVPIALSFAIVTVTAVGQVLKGSISGTATDPQGAVIKDAKVKATNTATLNERTETTDSTGSFRFNLIPAGDYTIEISAPGFKTLQQTHVTVLAGQDHGLGPIRLEVGETSTTVEVIAAAPL